MQAYRDEVIADKQQEPIVDELQENTDMDKEQTTAAAIETKQPVNQEPEQDTEDVH